MARENLGVFHGQVMGDPRIYINKDGEETKAMFVIRVLRRPTTSVEIVGSKLQIDCPVIMTRNSALIRIIRTIEAGDMVDIRGVITSKEVRKSTHCPACSNKNSRDGNIVYITPIYICKREHADETLGLQLLKERAEVSNLINVIGNLCREPQFYVDGNGKKYAQYQLAVNRRYRIKEDAAENRTDFPWIKTFGNQALEDSTCLHSGSSVYINGALQTRNIERNEVCEKCGEKYVWEESVAEIVPYYIGYLANCGTKDTAQNEEAQNGEEKTECSQQT